MARPIKRLVLILFFLTLMSCSGDVTHQAQGYIEGRYTYIARSVSGTLLELFVSRGMAVKQGQKLFVLEEQPESDAYRAALENLRESTNARNAIEANLAYAKLTYERYKVLVPKKAIQQSQLDNAKSIYEATAAQLAQANATIASATATAAQAKWTKGQKIAYAPVDGMVFDTYYRVGEYTEANKAIVSLLAPANIKAIFYISEPDVGKIKLGDKVTVRCNGCRQDYDGRISFISPTAEYTPPLIYSSDTNEKLVFRIEAEFEPQIASQLHPGQPVAVTYHTHG